MLLDVLDRSMETWVYNEDNSRAFENYRIKSSIELENIILQSRSKCVVFKSLADTQNIDLLLSKHPQSKALWLYRGFKDVADSAVRKWGKGQLALIRLLATKEKWNYWLRERIDIDTLELVRSFYDRKMTPQSAAAMKWFLRNKIFVDYQLDQMRDRVYLARYEDLVLMSSQEYRRLFRFLGLKYDESFISAVFSSSINKGENGRINPQVNDLCERLELQLNSFYDAQKVPHDGSQ